MRGGYRTRAARRIHGESILAVLLKAAVNEFRSEAIHDVGGDRPLRHFLEFAMPREHPRDLWWASAERERLDNWTREIGQPESLAARGALEPPYRFPRRLPTPLPYI